ncbi:MAG: class II glutamine amidotransferase, partial [Bdellovibrionales bacterium]|nr:class II glutamine amidotransferase [Bdellovibrionales bacterium]
MHKGLGLVADVFNHFDFDKLPGDTSLGHVRYTTAGSNRLMNVQPFYAETASGEFGLAHNGNLTNVERLRAQLIADGAIFASTSDTEVIQHLIARGPQGVPRVETIINALNQIEGAYSLLLMYDDRMFAVRDPKGFRPLAIGRLDDAWVFASETCAFDLIGATYERDVQPGEIFEVTRDGKTQSYFPFGVTKESPCIFEY